MTNTDSPVDAVVLDERTRFSLAELCDCGGVHAEVVIEMVEEGVLEPAAGAAPEEWRFTGTGLQRLQATLRLQRDLDLNLPGVAVVLDLLDEVERLRRRLDALGHRSHGD